jgi:hypothetical protein
VAVGTQRDTLLDLLPGGGKPSVSHQLVYTFFVRASDNVMKVNNCRVLQTTMGAFLRSLKLVPYFFLPHSINTGGLNMFFSVIAVPVVSVLLLFFFSLDGVFVWH